MGSGDPSGLQNQRKLVNPALVGSTPTRFRQIANEKATTMIHKSRNSKVDQRVATELWKYIGIFGFSVSVAAFSALASEKIADALHLVDLNSYAVTLFAIPLISVTVIAVTTVGSVYGLLESPDRQWFYRVPPIIDDLQKSTFARPVTTVIIVAFIVVPIVALSLSISKFFHGSYYYASVASAGCSDPIAKSCEFMGTGWKHFMPKYGIGSLTNTPYRYEGNKTYIPVLFPVIFLLLALVIFICSAYFFLESYSPGEEVDLPIFLERICVKPNLPKVHIDEFHKRITNGSSCFDPSTFFF